MSYSGFAADEIKNQKCEKCCTNLKSRLTCKICRLGSPKFWQLLQNDIPLLMAIPVAMVFDLIDPFTAIIALCLTVLDTISMLTYLYHDDDSGINANEVYELVQRRKWENEQDIKALKLDISEEENQGSIGLSSSIECG